jgi:hypothetical protein
MFERLKNLNQVLKLYKDLKQSFSNLNSGLWQGGFFRQFFSSFQIRIVALFKFFFQLVKLFWSEACSTSSKLGPIFVIVMGVITAGLWPSILINQGSANQSKCFYRFRIKSAGLTISEDGFGLIECGVSSLDVGDGANDPFKPCGRPENPDGRPGIDPPNPCRPPLPTKSPDKQTR